MNSGDYFLWPFGWLLLFPGVLDACCYSKGSLYSKLRGHKGNVHAKSANNDT